MRKICLGAAPHKGSWSPQFNKPKDRTARTNRVGRQNTSLMSYFPTIKGEPRMEGLRHYFHKDMALILDARPDVVTWTAKTKPIQLYAEGETAEFTPDFTVRLERGGFAIRLLRKAVKSDSASADYLELADLAYRESGLFLRVVTAAEIAMDPMLPIARTLFMNRVREWDPDLPWVLSDAWGDNCPTTLGVIHVDLGGRDESWLQLLSLAAHGNLILDLKYGLGPDTPVLACRGEGYRQ